MMSQDTDALCVVWHDSPGASQLGPAALGRISGGGGASQQQQQPPPSAPQQDFRAIKQRLISAAARPRGPLAARGGGQPLLAGGRPAGADAGADAMLEGLFSHMQQQQQAAAAAPRPGGRPGGGSTLAAVPECSVFSGSLSVDAGGGGAHRTPATHLKGILKKGGAPGSQPQAGGAQRLTPASGVKFSLGGAGGVSSTAKLGAGRSTGRAHGGGGGGAARARRQSGQKRKALLELLEQVESLVQVGGAEG